MILINFETKEAKDKYILDGTLTAHSDHSHVKFRSLIDDIHSKLFQIVLKNIIKIDSIERLLNSSKCPKNLLPRTAVYRTSQFLERSSGNAKKKIL